LHKILICPPCYCLTHWHRYYQHGGPEKQEMCKGDML
jgi:hypothetical protein